VSRPLVNDSSEFVRRIATRLVKMRENRLAHEESENSFFDRRPHAGGVSW